MKITKILLDMHDVSGQVDVPKTVGFGVNKPGPVLVNRASVLELMLVIVLSARLTCPPPYSLASANQ
jgi:hypothetical protein